MDAAANAFADFRLAIIASDELTQNDAEELLRQKTRRAAARLGVNTVAARTRGAGVEGCDGQEIRLVRYTERTLAPSVANVFAEHVASCHTCAAALGRLEAGERAFERPPSAPLPQHVADEIVHTLAFTLPVRACGANAAVVYEEALRLLTGDDVDPAHQPAPPIQAGPRTDPTHGPDSAVRSSKALGRLFRADRGGASGGGQRAGAPRWARAGGRRWARRRRRFRRRRRCNELRHIGSQRLRKAVSRASLSREPPA